MKKDRTCSVRGLTMFLVSMERVKLCRKQKENLLASIELYKKHNSTVPKELQGEISVEWTFDVQSFLQYYNGIFTKAALERITGVNQKLLGHYASGLKKPRKAQVEKIESALHGFLNDISQVHLA